MEDDSEPASGAARVGLGGAEPSGSGSGDGNDVSAFASPDFDPVGFLNRLFPDESSLAGVEPLVQKLRLRVRRVDDEILAAVRSQSTGGARAKADLAQAQSAIGSLEQRVADIKRKAETSEATVREVCADVKKLDFAKKHLTSTITSLRRLSMLVSAVDQLESFVSSRAYKESANLLDAVNELAAHFETYSDVPKVAEIKRRRDDCESALRAAVFEDFHVNWQPSVVESDAAVAERLRDACAVVDALDPKHREALTGDLTNKELTGYASVFDKLNGAGGDSKGLDQGERRYAWIKRNLKAKGAMWGVFPEHWRFPHLLCMSLCKLTRAHLAELLDAEARSAEVQTVLQAMHKTVAFERDLDEHFGLKGGDRVSGFGDAGRSSGEQTVSDSGAAGAFGAALGDDADAASAVRAKHAARRRESRLAEQKGGRALPMDSAAEALRDISALSFRDVVSSCFEDHLGGYVDMEERQLVEELERLVGDETWGATRVVARGGEKKSAENEAQTGPGASRSGSSLQGLQSSLAKRMGAAAEAASSRRGSASDLAGAAADTDSLRVALERLEAPATIFMATGDEPDYGADHVVAVNLARRIRRPKTVVDEEEDGDEGEAERGDRKDAREAADANDGTAANADAEAATAPPPVRVESDDDDDDNDDDDDDDDDSFETIMRDLASGVGSVGDRPGARWWRRAHAAVREAKESVCSRYPGAAAVEVQHFRGGPCESDRITTLVVPGGARRGWTVLPARRVRERAPGDGAFETSDRFGGGLCDAIELAHARATSCERKAKDPKDREDPKNDDFDTAGGLSLIHI